MRAFTATAIALPLLAAASSFPSLPVRPCDALATPNRSRGSETGPRRIPVAQCALCPHVNPKKGESPHGADP